jgi:hypothetical protein
VSGSRVWFVYTHVDISDGDSTCHDVLMDWRVRGELVVSLCSRVAGKFAIKFEFRG